ncbi:MAG: hypothetical protein IJ661_05120 [Lachnospiraceae bacterium]|nr:hypothetical protein [Lachnospiraceae bacterium]
MERYKRNVTYFYQFHNGVVGATAGFLKMELRGDDVKITINIQEPYRSSKSKPVLCLYHEMGDILSAVKICEVDRQGGVLTMQTKTPWRQMFNTGRDLYTFDGALVMYSNNDYYIGDFADRDRSTYDIKIDEERESKKEAYDRTDARGGEPEKKSGALEGEPEKKRGALEGEQEKESKALEGEPEKGIRALEGESEKKKGALKGESEKESRTLEGERIGTEHEKTKWEKSKNETDGEDIEQKTREYETNEERGKQELQERAGVMTDFAGRDRCEDCPYKESSANSFDGMIAEYPKLPMYNVDELFDCVRINPKDIGKLDIGNWKLGSNSFLTHGYYTYKYLMLGRMRFDDGTRHAVLGVPGVYSNRERYLANMFGFDTFIPVKKTGQKTGQFGYWIAEINCG